MILATITLPLIGDNGTAVWGDRFADGDFEHTLFSAFGVHDGWIAILPVFLLCALSAWAAARATPAVNWSRAPLRAAFGAIAAWAIASAVGPTITGDPNTPLAGGQTTLTIIAAGALGAVLTLGWLRYRAREAEPAADGAGVPVPALGESSS
jgi:hypothetical protein